MEKQVVQKRWKLIFWGLTAAAVALLAPGLVLTLEPALFWGWAFWRLWYSARVCVLL